MTEQERQLIQSLADRLRNAPAPQVNPEADELIRRTIGAMQNALYILTQTVLLQELALNELKSQNKPSFLGTAPPPGTWGRDARLQQAPSGEGYGGAYKGNYRGSSYESGAPPSSPLMRPQTPPQTAWGASQPQSRTSSFLQGAAQTAAGVVAGQVAFSALSSLFGGHHHGGFFGGGGWDGWGSGGGIHETVINNNYFDESPSQDVHEASFDPDSFTSDVSDSIDDDTSYDGGSDTFDV